MTMHSIVSTLSSMPRSHLIMLLGMPASGKAELASRITQELSAVRISADDWLSTLDLSLITDQGMTKIEHPQWLMGKQAMIDHNPVVMEWGIWSKVERVKARDEAKQLGATVSLIVLDPPLTELWAKIQSCDLAELPMTHDELARYSTYLERPDAEELAGYDYQHVVTAERVA